jgi:hypothetical protein
VPDQPGRTAAAGHDPLGKRALFEAPVMAAPDTIATGRTPEGKAALFSVGEHRPGTVVVRCSRCRARTRLSLVDLGMRMARFGVFLPARRHHQYLLQCPSCGDRRWCSVSWRG